MHIVHTFVCVCSIYVIIYRCGHLEVKESGESVLLTPLLGSEHV